MLRWVLDHTSMKDYQAWGKSLGLTHPLQGNISEVLGGNQTPMGMANAFGVFALRGVAPSMHLIRKITDREGRILERHIERRLATLGPHAGVGFAAPPRSRRA